MTRNEHISNLYAAAERMQRSYLLLEGEPEKLVRDAATSVFQAIAKLVKERAETEEVTS